METETDQLREEHSGMRRLGRTDLLVSPLSLGGLFTSSLAGGISETKRILRRASELGINFLDTAPAYADSERVVGQAMLGVEKDFIVSTKLGGRPVPFDPQDRSGLRRSVEESLSLLNREVIDLLLIHEPDRPQQYPWWTTYDPLDGPVLEVITELKQQGKIRYTGLAGTTVNELCWLVEQGSFDVVLTAFNYNPLYREADRELIPAACRRDMGIIVGSVLGQGFLGRRFDEVLQQSRPIWLAEIRRQQFLAYYQLLDESGLSAVEMGIRFALSGRQLSTVLVGCKTMEQLEESVAASERGRLPSDILTRLDQIAAMVPFRPFEEPMILPFGKSYHGPAMANVGASVKVGR